MFGKNTITGQSFFKDVDDKLLVVSRFFSNQGEGPYRGHPAMFVRLAKCNLNCHFCDTYFDNGDWLTISELMTEVNSTIDRHFNGSLPRFLSGPKKKARECTAMRPCLSCSG
jgi:hypothetical protein